MAGKFRKIATEEAFSIPEVAKQLQAVSRVPSEMIGWNKTRSSSFSPQADSNSKAANDSVSPVRAYSSPALGRTMELCPSAPSRNWALKVSLLFTTVSQ